MKKITLLFLTLFIVLNTQGQNPENQAPIIFIYDASGSMWGQLQGKTKMEFVAEFTLEVKEGEIIAKTLDF